MKRGLLLVFLVLLSVSLVSGFVVDEGDATADPACNDNWDNDGDGKADFGGCINLTTGVITPFPNTYSTWQQYVGFCVNHSTEYMFPDPGCLNDIDDSEENMCGDGWDNDWDMRTDYTGGCDTDGDHRIDYICGCDMDGDAWISQTEAQIPARDCNRTIYEFGCKQWPGYEVSHRFNTVLNCSMLNGTYFAPDTDCASESDDDEAAAGQQNYVEPVEYVPHNAEGPAPIIIDDGQDPNLGMFVRSSAPEEEQSWFMKFLAWFGLVE